MVLEVDKSYISKPLAMGGCIDWSLSVDFSFLAAGYKGYLLGTVPDPAEMHSKKQRKRMRTYTQMRSKTPHANGEINDPIISIPNGTAVESLNRDLKEGKMTAAEAWAMLRKAKAAYGQALDSKIIAVRQLLKYRFTEEERALP